MKKSYKVLHPIGLGGRRERGEVVELTDDEAKAIGSELVTPVTEEQPQEPQVEKPLDEMTKDELVEKATSLGLPHGGSKADLLERINLHLEQN